MSAETTNKDAALPWWRVRMVWLAISGPLAVVIASGVTLGLAIKGSDPVVQEHTAQSGGQDAATMPAIQARNHAATH